MGNNRFRLSDVMPHAWFYKLKDMGSKTRNRTPPSSKNYYGQQISSAAAAATQQPPSKPNISYPRKSYYITRELISSDLRIHNSPTNTKSHFPDPPRRSSKLRVRRRVTNSSSKLVNSSVSSACNCRSTLWAKSDSPPEYSASLSDTTSLEQDPDFSHSFPPSHSVPAIDSFDKMVSWSSSCGCKLDANINNDDIVINVDKQSLAEKFDNLDVFDNISDLNLPPILTKPTKLINEDIKKTETQEPANCGRRSVKYEQTNTHDSLSVMAFKADGNIKVKEHKTTSSRRHSVNSTGVRLRVNSPRISNIRRIQAYNGRKSGSSKTSTSYSCSRRSLSDSLAIVKSSFDPQKDFRESMLEMIVENNIKGSKDLEDLLACYLSLNSDEYHDLIVKVFKQIWFDLTSG